MMQNHEIAKVLDEVGEMLEVAGENFFRVRAYHNAARAIRDQPGAVAELSSQQIDEIPGIAADLAGKIATIVKTGDLPLHRELSAKFPKELLTLCDIPGLGPKRVKVLADLLHVHGRDDLERAVRSGKLRTIRGFGAKSEARILEALAKSNGAGKRILFSEAAAIASKLLEHMRKCRAIDDVAIAGSFRRCRETVGDLDVVVSARDREPCLKQFKSFPDVGKVAGSGETKTTVMLKSGLQVDLRVVAPESFGAALLYSTGSKAHNIHLRRIAQDLGLLLNEYGLLRDKKMIAAARTEEEVYKALSLPWIAPELREDRGELEAAATGRLPKLITRRDLRGDLHSHSTYTDGRASIEDMAQRARDLGLDYLAITDHSRRVTMAHGLTTRQN